MKAKLFLVLTLLFFSISYSQIEFQEILVVDEPSYTTIYPSLSHCADIDGDGDLDIFTTGRDINWYENLDGKGSFGTKNVIPNSFISNYLYTIDIDLDGDIDLIASSYPKIYLFENLDGKGDFSIKNSIEVGGDINRQRTSFSIADIDNDGDKDIVSLYVIGSFPSTKTNFVWYENMDGLGTYSTTAHIINTSNTSAYSEHIYTDDLNGDGNIDIIASQQPGNKIFWLENIDGNGNFESEQIITTEVDGVKSIFIIDVDKDGYVDIISASENDNKIAWYKNIDGNGTFGPQQIITTNAISVQSIHMDDFDEDGDIDLLSAASTDKGLYPSLNSKVAWYENIDGNGNFSTEKIITTKAYGAKHVIAKDIDGDNHLDVISSSKDDKKIAYYINPNGDGNFIDQINISRSVNNALIVCTGDIDGDNDIDIISASREDSKLAWYENIDGKGLFSNERVIEETIDESSSNSLCVEDIDGDGDLDIIRGINSTPTSPSKVAWFENIDGKGHFDIEHLVGTGSEILTSWAQSYDIDNDGDMDLVLGGYTGGRIYWYENLDGKGNFGPKNALGSNSSPLISFHGNDLDSDGDIDIVAVHHTTSTNYWYENTDGKGFFEKHTLSNRTSNVPSLGEDAVYTADVDGDNDIDIICMGEFGVSDGISWFENEDGNGNFNIEHKVETTPFPGNFVYASDLDNDGDMDILSASGAESNSGPAQGLTRWYENIDGKGGFSGKKIIDETSGYITHSVKSADINGDGFNDVIASYGHFAGWTPEGKISWYKNSGGSLNNKELDNLVKLSLYPNPTNGILNIKSKSMIKRLNIYNNIGQLVAYEIDKNTINITKLSNGIYFIKIENMLGDFETKKIIKK